MKIFRNSLSSKLYFSKVWLQFLFIPFILLAACGGNGGGDDGGGGGNPPAGTQTLTITKTGSGSGTVTSAPVGIDCGSDCSENYADGTDVTLTATPIGDSIFEGWGGAPDCADGTVNMATSKTCTATFNNPPGTQTLSITKAGTGSGTVTSAPAGIDCGPDCSENYADGTDVTLTATPIGDSIFEGWSGAPDCADGTVSMTTSKTCTATFNTPPGTQALTITKLGSGSGTVTSAPAGIDCGSDCSENYADGTDVTLTATPIGGATFVGWSGDPDCADGTVSMTTSKTCTATFNNPPPPGMQTLSIAKPGTGSGTVTSAPAGIDCGLDCSENYVDGTDVTLTATPIGGATFVGWSGACVGTGACSVTMDAARLVTANFTPGATGGTGTAISLSSYGPNSCALLSDGTVQCWGHNVEGQLGNGMFNPSSAIPVSVIGISSATAVSVGSLYSCALLSDGTVQCWGHNVGGQLGDGTFNNSNIPVSVAGLSTATAVSAGGAHTCALLSDGTVKCWGSNGFGQLGDGTFNLSTIPVPVIGISSATAVSTGGAHSCALLLDGAVQCWGRNSKGQLGDGTFNNLPFPVPVTGISSATAVSAEVLSSCAVLLDGTVQCWGWNVEGQLGNGTFNDTNTPVPVTGISTATAVSVGAFHSCALLSDGIAQCWGRNVEGQLGDETFNNSNIPVSVAGLSTATAVSAGALYSCALLPNSTVQCWGWNVFGQLGDGTFNDSGTPVTVLLP